MNPSVEQGQPVGEMGEQGAGSCCTVVDAALASASSSASAAAATAAAAAAAAAATDERPSDAGCTHPTSSRSEQQWHSQAGHHQNTFQGIASPQLLETNRRLAENWPGQAENVVAMESMTMSATGTAGQSCGQSVVTLSSTVPNCDPDESRSPTPETGEQGMSEDEGSQRDWSLTTAMDYRDETQEATTTTTTTHSLRKRINRRPVQEKVRHKRQTLQDMSRPLKQWLYAHKDHPYPTKSDKVALARDSKMTLTQVSNWFANARRRLKNTVKGPDMGWEKRIRLYNSCVEGNQELLSISSQDSMWESEEDTEKDKEVKSMEVGDSFNTPDVTSPPPLPLSPVSPHPAQQQHTNPLLQTERVCVVPQTGPPTVPPTVSATPAACDVSTTSPDVCHSNHGQHEQPSKFKHSILQRYLNDSYEHSLQVQNSSRTGSGEERHRNPSGSLSSHDYEDISVSSRSSPVREHLVLDELSDFEEISRQWPRIEDRAEEDLYWMEISAALALTTLAKSRHKPVSSSATE